MSPRTVSVFLLIAAASSLLFTPAADACAASYMKRIADQGSQTNLYDKASKVADKYMQVKGIQPSSPTGQVARPYVIGTTLYDNQTGTMSGNIRNYPSVQNGEWQGHLLNKSVDDCVRDCLTCPHHEGHFSDGLEQAKTQGKALAVSNLGG